MRAANQQSKVHKGLEQALGRVATGRRIVSAADDSAGSAVSVSLSVQISSTRQAIRNTNDGLSMSHIAQGAVKSSQDILMRGRELAVQASSETLNTADRAMIDDEWNVLKNEMRRISLHTRFNDQEVTNGERYNVQVGSQNTSNDRISLQMGNVRKIFLDVFATKMTIAAAAQDALDSIDTAMDRSNSQLATLGAQENRLMEAMHNATSQLEALSQSRSRIVDADMADATTQMTAMQVKNQASAAALSQAGQLSYGVVGLISS